MAKYKVYYSGFAYIEADSEENAIEDYEDFAYYEEKHIDEVEEVDEFVIYI